MSGTTDEPSAGRRLVRPPRLRTLESAAASNLELFFDVAYVWVVLELAATYLHDLTWNGTLVIGGLFAAIWFSWVGFTLYANRFDTDDVVFRMAKLTATLAIAGCAASADGATTDLSTPFGFCYLTTIVVLALLHLRVWWHLTEARPTIAVYTAATAAGAVVWAAGMLTSGVSRYACWAVAILIGASGPVLATLRGHTSPLLVEHLAERFGLWVILVLVGVGIEALVIDGGTAGSTTAEWVLAGGVMLFLVGAAVIVGGTARNWTSIWPWPGAVIAVPPVIAALTGSAPLATVGALAVVVAYAAAYATLRGARRSTGESDDRRASASPE